MAKEDNDFTIEEQTYDVEGYGVDGNIVTIMMLHRMLDKEEAEEYRKELKKENPKAYNQFLDYEKQFLKYAKF